MQHIYRSISGWATYAPFYAWASQQVPLVGARCVECGVAYGQGVSSLAVELLNRGCTDARIDLVDTGDPSTALRNLEPVRGVIGSFHNMNSWEAASLYEPGSLDLVYIDANHSKEAVLRDIAAWRTRLKPGAILAGHDFAAYPGLGGVIDAVIESFSKFHVDRGEKFSDGLYYASWWTRIGENGQEID